MEPIGIEPMTSWMQTRRSSNMSYSPAMDRDGNRTRNLWLATPALSQIELRAQMHALPTELRVQAAGSPNPAGEGFQDRRLDILGDVESCARSGMTEHARLGWLSSESNGDLRFFRPA